MNLIIVHPLPHRSDQDPLLRLLDSNDHVAGHLLERLGLHATGESVLSVRIAVPEPWLDIWRPRDERVLTYRPGQPIAIPDDHKQAHSGWLVISRGRFITDLDLDWLVRDLTRLDAHVVSVTVDPKLNGYQERTCYSSDGTVAGFRRRYMAATCLEAAPEEWPHHLFVRSELCDPLFPGRLLTLDYPAMQQRVSQNGLAYKHLSVPGQLVDLHRKLDRLNGVRDIIYELFKRQPQLFNGASRAHAQVHPTARLCGPVLLSPGVQIDPEAVIVGPALIGRDVHILEKALVRASLITAGGVIHPGEQIDNLWIGSEEDHQTRLEHSFDNLFHCYRMVKNATGVHADKQNFRVWPPNAYPYTGKRIADIIISLIVLSLFLPIFPIIALIIKLGSPGPIFFGHKRQGLHGKPFTCWKFRSMIPGADDLQASLRMLNEVDGPQFRIEDDPRINRVGHFLRDTFLDEIPQFWNVLCGEMSVVGPRPSPEKENALCPPWRDARLSVRPGVTGLWQVMRTRRASQDFQEWVHYDTEYVKTLSFKKDIWICWETFKQMVRRFLEKF